MPIEVGGAAPAFQSVDQDGTAHTLEQHRGKWLLLYFYPKDDTSGCTAEACGFRDLYPQLRDKIAILGVSADSAESHQAFRQKYQLPFPLLADSERKVIDAYRATKEAMGKRVSFLIDPSGKIAKIYQTIDCAGHATEVENDLNRKIGI